MTEDNQPKTVPQQAIDVVDAPSADEYDDGANMSPAASVDSSTAGGIGAAGESLDAPAEAETTGEPARPIQTSADSATDEVSTTTSSANPVATEQSAVASKEHSSRGVASAVIAVLVFGLLSYAAIMIYRNGQ